MWLPRLEQLVSGEGVGDVRFTGIRFAHATWLRPGQVSSGSTRACRGRRLRL